MQTILYNLQNEFKKNVDLKYKRGCTNFFREDIKIFGVRTPIVRKISLKYFNIIKDRPKKDILNMCELLLGTGIQENALVAFAWAKKINKLYTKQDFKIFERWVKKYISNWAMCDDFCTHALGDLVSKYPELIPKLKKWTKSRNRWVKRASAVIFINLIKKKNYLKDIFWTADQLLTDEDDMVQKGYGWMLKVAADFHPKEVFAYVMKKKNKMPRTALRYAIEKMPKTWKTKAMKI
ncbi:MAG: DNA alkylation repair protein [Candidatus Magasanikbacteria bacterium]|nr:DNA alkylation repair protein [Candidatus Magasanikbacteria bacterium]